MKNLNLKDKQEVLWINKKCSSGPMGSGELLCIHEGYRQLAAEVFDGMPASELRRIETFQIAASRIMAGSLPGMWYAKPDNELPISGSVKIRGALYEVLKYARSLTDGPLKDADFTGRTISVASTGNLGLSVGLTARTLGFGVRVYMSREAVAWKADMLRAQGAEVILVDGDYSRAVSICREDSQRAGHYFVDDERSELLYRGYACAAVEIAESDVVKNSEAPVCVYLPCGVGNAPAGIAAGLKALLGERVHVFLAEPVEVPSVLVGLATGKRDETDVYEYGRSGRTVADGLACPRMSGKAAPILEQCVSGIYTVEDDKMLGLLKLVGECENIRIEPSAAASLLGMMKLYYTGEGIGYLRDAGVISNMDESIHISWLTGGGLLPEEEYQKLYQIGEEKEKLLCDFL